MTFLVFSFTLWLLPSTSSSRASLTHKTADENCQIEITRLMTNARSFPITRSTELLPIYAYAWSVCIIMMKEQQKSDYYSANCVHTKKKRSSWKKHPVPVERARACNEFLIIEGNPAGKWKHKKSALFTLFFCAYYFSLLCKSDRQLGPAHVGSWGWDFFGQRDCFCLHFTLVTLCSTPFNTLYTVHVIFIYSWCFRYRQRKNFFFGALRKIMESFSKQWLMAIFNDFIIFLSSFHPFSALKLIANQGRASGCCTRDGTAWVGEQTFQ